MANDFMQSKIRILETNCDPSRASDRTLPYTSYLVEYLDDTAKRCYDLIICNKQVDIFDHYWDRYRHTILLDGSRRMEESTLNYGTPLKQQKK